MSSFTAKNITTFYSDQPSGATPERPTVLLISGLGSQHTSWRVEFKHRLVAAGYRVLTMDNRDVGLSTHVTGKVVVEDVIATVLAEGQPDVPYLLSDMADDCVRLLDHLKIDAAHIVGLSMGGMIAQTVAIRHPKRTLSLTSIMSTTGNPEVGEATPEGQASMFMPPPRTRTEAIETSKAIGRVLATERTYEEAVHEADARASIERDYDNAGVARQLAAIIASGDRTEELSHLATPTLVIHGSADPLIGLSGGTATATAVPGAKLVVVDNMGHDLPIGQWQPVLGAMISHFDSVAKPAAEVRILPAHPDHVDQLAAIASQAFLTDQSSPANPATLGEDQHRELIGQECHEIWQEGDLVGACYTSYLGAGDWQIESIFIDPSRQRTGLGSRLLEFVDRSVPWCKQISADSPTAIKALWQAAGYRSTEPATDTMVRYRRDSWQLPWVPTIAETAATASALSADIESRDLHGISLLDDETAAQFSDMLIGYVDELQGNTDASSTSPVAEGRRWMRAYLRTFRGTKWMQSGGHIRMMVVHSMLRRLTAPAKNRLLDLRGLYQTTPPEDDAGRRIWEKATSLLNQFEDRPADPDRRAATAYLAKLSSELVAGAAPDLIFGGGSNQAVLAKAKRISGAEGTQLADIVKSVTARAEAIYAEFARH